MGVDVDDEVLEEISEREDVTMEEEDVTMEEEGLTMELEDVMTEVGRLRPKEETTVLSTSGWAPTVLLPRVPFHITGHSAASRSRLLGTQLHI